MDNLWAPWRMDYILDNNKADGCIFCPQGVTGYDRERLILHVGERALVMMNRYPYNNGHLMAAPVRHVPDLTSLDSEEMAELWQLVKLSTECLQEIMEPDGFNIGINIGEVSGAGMASHLHVHVVPRWLGDTNFMTVLSEVRSIPEHLDQTFDRLRPLFARAFGED